MHRASLAGVIRRALVLSVFSAATASASDDVVVVRVGTGSVALDATTAAVVLERRASDGSLVTSIPMPIAADANHINMPFTLSGTGTTEGAIAGNPDGNFLTLAGYAVAPGAPISNAVRVVARIDTEAVIDTSTTLGNGFSTAVRGAVTDDGSHFWISGSGSGDGGIWYELLGLGGGTQLVSSPSGVNAINIVSGQLYADSSSKGNTNVFKIGSGLPVTIDPTTTALAGMPTSNASPYGFAFFDRTGVLGIDTVYVADDRATASGGGIQKWSWNGTTWSLQKTFTSGITTGVRGLAAEVVAGKAVIYATTTEVTQNKLVKLIDDGSASPAMSIIATASANTVYRGVAMAWVPPLLDDVFTDGFE
ncbi:MAG TPA: hypothetical protein VH082_12330 [Rudaea sp.]|jgi:hypothetical protein|nr:hypothetical protein [Rudaea sp.]